MGILLTFMFVWNMIGALVLIPRCRIPAAQGGGMTMLGLMQEHKLLVSSLIEHAVNCHPDAEIVSRTVEGPIHLRTAISIGARSRSPTH